METNLKTATIFDPLGEKLCSFRYDPETLYEDNHYIKIPNILLEGKDYEKIIHAFKHHCIVGLEVPETFQYLVSMDVKDSFPEMKENGSFVVRTELGIRTGPGMTSLSEVPEFVKERAMCGWSPISEVPKHKTMSDNVSFILDNGVKVGEGRWYPDGGADYQGTFRWIDEYAGEYSCDMDPQPLYYQPMPISFKDRYRG